MIFAILGVMAQDAGTDVEHVISASMLLRSMGTTLYIQCGMLPQVREGGTLEKLRVHVQASKLITGWIRG